MAPHSTETIETIMTLKQFLQKSDYETKMRWLHFLVNKRGDQTSNLTLEEVTAYGFLRDWYSETT